MPLLESTYKIKMSNDVHEISKKLNDHTAAIIATQIESTHSIISSQERISEGIDNVSYGLENIEDGIYGLKAAFEWGFSEVIWQIEQNRKILKNIVDKISAPLDTQSKELRIRAEKAYKNGWFDDALNDFIRAEKNNRYDFTIHINLGHIYFFHKSDIKTALHYYENAIKYSKPESKYYCSYALMHKAFLKYLQKDIMYAEKIMDEAVNLSPNFAEALYRNAQYSALMNKPEKSIGLLSKAIKIDVNYCEKILNESDFDKIIKQIIELFKKLKDDEIKKVSKAKKSIIQKKKCLNEKIKKSQKFGILFNTNSNFKNLLNRVNELIERNSYRDILEANRLIVKLNEDINNSKKQLKEELKKLLSSMHNFIEEFNTSLDILKSSQNYNIFFCFWSFPLVIFLINQLYTFVINYPHITNVANFTSKFVGSTLAGILFFIIPLINWISLFYLFNEIYFASYFYICFTIFTILSFLIIIICKMKISNKKNIRRQYIHRKEELTYLIAVLN